MPTNRRAYGRLPKTEDRRDYAFRAPSPYSGAFVDLSSGFPEKPYDQLNLGSCVSNGTAALLDFARAKQGLQPLNRPSRLFVYYNGRLRGNYPLDQDTGLEVRDGLDVVGKDGAPPEDTDWPYDVSKFANKPSTKAYTDAKNDLATKYASVAPADMDATIASGYPVVIGFDVYESFESDTVASTGVMPVPKRGEKNVGGHCVVVVSTPKDGAEIPGAVAGVKYRLCRNSWGPDWGLGGYFWFPVSEMTRSASDFWVLTHVEDPNVNPPQPPNPPTDPFDSIMSVLRKAWKDLDTWLKKHGL